MSGELCSVCGVVVDRFWLDQGIDLHPTCDRSAMFGTLPHADPLKQELAEIILWADGHSDRSLQGPPGPSELGDPCDRKLAMKIAGLPKINTAMDPWAAIVGTAVHAWIEKAVLKFQAAGMGSDWLTEQTVQVDPMIQGHADLYQISRKRVVDVKTYGSTMHTKLKKGEVPEGYITQLQLYAMGYENSGIPVEQVSLYFVPRAGWLSDALVFTYPYDQDRAKKALARMYELANRLLQLDILNNPHRWLEIPATPTGQGCAYCPFFRPSEADLGPDSTGCPGR